MLVLSRQLDESIMIGDGIVVTVVDIRGDKVRLGITAPTKIAVHRKEVYEAIKLEQEQVGGRVVDHDSPDVTKSLQQLGLGPQRTRVRFPPPTGRPRR